MEAMRAGAHDYVLKDKLARACCPRVEREIRECKGARGASPAGGRFRALIEKSTEAHHASRPSTGPLDSTRARPAATIFGVRHRRQLDADAFVDFVHPDDRDVAAESARPERTSHGAAFASSSPTAHSAGSRSRHQPLTTPRSAASSSTCATSPSARPRRPSGRARRFARSPSPGSSASSPRRRRRHPRGERRLPEMVGYSATSCSAGSGGATHPADHRRRRARSSSRAAGAARGRRKRFARTGAASRCSSAWRCSSLRGRIAFSLDLDATARRRAEDALRTERGAAPPGAEDGGGRPARRRRRARLQQRALGHPELRAISCSPSLKPDGSAARPTSRRSASGRERAAELTRQLLDVQPAAGARAKGHRPQRGARGHGEDAPAPRSARTSSCVLRRAERDRAGQGRSEPASSRSS